MERKQYLGGAISTNGFTEAYLRKKVEEWVNDVQKLSEISKTSATLCIIPI